MPTAAKNKKTVVKKPAAKKTVSKKPEVRRPVKAKTTKLQHRKPAKTVEAKRPVAKPVVAAKPSIASPKAHVPSTRPVEPVPVQAAVRPAAPVVAPTIKKVIFKTGEQVVYPAHGVGRIVQVEEQEIAGTKLELYIVDFEKEKLRLRVPTNKAEVRGMRKLADKPLIDQAMKVLRGRARIKRTMWSRRAQEYESKINSGDLISVAEVVRDLYRSDKQPEQSYSERQLFEQALERMAREIAAVKKIDDDMAVKELETYLEKNAHKNVRAAAEEEIQAEEAA